MTHTLLKRAKIGNINNLTYHDFRILGNKTQIVILQELVERLTPQIDECANGRLSDLELLRKWIGLDYDRT